jgi:polar amino acid transport system substrate-binding protein
MKLRKNSALAAILGAATGMAFGVFTASAADLKPPSSLVNSGKLTYATAATFAPFEYMEDGKLVGFDIEMMDEIAKRMGLEPNPLSMEFKGLIPALQGSRADIINSGMYIKPERAKVVDFIPYMRVGNQLVVAAKNPHNIQIVDNLCGLRVAVTLGGFQEGLANEQSKTCTEAGRKEVDVLTFPSAQDAALALKQGRADAIFNSTPGAVKQVTALPDVYAIGGNPFGPYFLVGVAVRKGESETKAAIEAGMKSLMADGTFDSLLKKYKFPMAAKNLE